MRFMSLNVGFLERIALALFFTFLSLFIPPIRLNIDINIYLTIISLLFTILTGFFIAAATSNYLRLQSLISQEDGSLMSIYTICKLLFSSSVEKIADKIDTYLITSLNFEMSDYVERSEQEFKNLVEEIEKNATKIAINDLVSALYNQVGDLYKIRQEIFIASSKIVGRIHWLILIFLVLLINMLLIGLRTPDWVSYFITGALIFTLYLVLILVYEVDNNLLLEDKISYEDSQKVFKTIGRLRYYPEEAIKRGIVREPKENYRLGISNSEESTKRKIKIIEVSSKN